MGARDEAGDAYILDTDISDDAILDVSVDAERDRGAEEIA